MLREELDEYLIADGLNELEIQMGQLKSWISRKRWGEVYVRIGSMVKLLQGIHNVVKRKEKER